MKHFVLTFFLLFSLANSFAQVTQVSRKEMEWDEEGVGNTIVIGDKGLLIHGDVNTDGDTYNWKITPLDVNLNEKTAVSFPVPNKYHHQGTCKSEDNKMVYFLFANKKGAFQLTSYNTES